MPKIYLLEVVLFLCLPVLMFNQWVGFIGLLGTGSVMYLFNSPLQLHFLKVAEEDYPDSMVFASSFNSIFSSLGISIGSATGSWVMAKASLNALGPVAAIYAFLALSCIIALNKANQKQKN